MGNAEVHDLRAPVVGDSNIGRLDVAVYDAALVGEGEAREDVDDDVESGLQRERLAQLDQALEIHALNEFHRDEEVAVHLSEVVDADHVRMLQRSRRLRLVQEALTQIFLPRDRFVHHLDRDGPLED